MEPVWSPEEGYRLRLAYNRRWAQEDLKVLRLKAIAKLGGRCSRCGARASKVRLELHHIVYLDGSVRDGHARQRAQEALAHPDRFKLLCRKCHLEAEPGKYPKWQPAWHVPTPLEKRLSELLEAQAKETVEHMFQARRHVIASLKKERREGRAPEIHARPEPPNPSRYQHNAEDIIRNKEAWVHASERPPSDWLKALQHRWEELELQRAMEASRQRSKRINHQGP